MEEKELKELENEEVVEEAKEESEATEEVIESEEEQTEEALDENEEKAEEAIEDSELALAGEEVVEEQTEELPPMEPIVEVATTYDYKALKYCNMYIIKVKRKSMLIYLIMSLISFAIGGVFIYNSIKNGDSNYIFGIIIAILGIWTLSSLFTEESKIDKSLINYFRTHAPFTQKFSFDNEKIRVSAFLDGEEKVADYDWAYIQEIVALPEYFFLFLNGGTPIIIDRNVESIVSGTTEDLENLIREQASLKPFVQYDKPLVKKMVNVTYYVKPEEPVEEQKEENEESQILVEEPVVQAEEDNSLEDKKEE